MSNKFNIARERLLYNDLAFSLRSSIQGHKGHSLNILQSVVTGFSVLACAAVFVIF